MLVSSLIVCTGLFRKKDFEQTSGYDESMKEGLEDWDFWLTLLGKGGEVFRIPKALFFYRIKEKSRNNSITEAQSNKLCNHLYYKHFELYKKYLPSPLHIYIQNEKLREQVELLKESNSFKIGQLIIKPFVIIKKLLTRNQS
jgi:hypothetical protein